MIQYKWKQNGSPPSYRNYNNSLLFCIRETAQAYVNQHRHDVRQTWLYSQLAMHEEQRWLPAHPRQMFTAC